MADIVLSTLNARYIHTAIGLRSIRANLKEFRERTTIAEYTISDQLIDVAEKLLALEPRIIGLGVYIWNGLQVAQLIRIIKAVDPGVIIVLGGPEVSHLPLRLELESADYLVQGEGENNFYRLCRELLAGHRPEQRLIPPDPPDPGRLVLPYDEYLDEDILHRVCYVEASRGCPFCCEFCLSSMDKTVRYFPLEAFLAALETLWQRGARNFKFIDRTFNLQLATVTRILDFFLAKEPPYLVHFEVIPDHFPPPLKEQLRQFPPGSLQLEVGIQTLNPEVAAGISRRLNMDKIRTNLRFLEQETRAHLHVDLIIGLPGESAQGFGDNLNLLTSLTRAEIQLGVLKKLSGTAISRHDRTHRMVYSPLPPYEILATDQIDFQEMQGLKRLTRFWDLLYNSGNFPRSVRLLWEEGDTFQGFKAFSGWLYQETHSTWKISLKRMAELLYRYLVEELQQEGTRIAEAIAGDLQRIQGRPLPPLIRAQLKTGSKKPAPAQAITEEAKSIGRRQQKHLA
ncbi:B12-binding domain-containing radical SAM protein [Desulfogranum mediterraneum]|uniref:B12-binding domain-containing radical SAM protein n=1 Tax=Desulfogranum mediterraneum TaxID=160661 RepID=UPI00040B0F39|nr:DUF4080 domain-containing protein [Desulfogranum mediterraneum]